MVKRPKLTESSPEGSAGAQSNEDVKYPRRTERRRRTRAAILEVAEELFRKYGYGPVTMQAISDAADIHVTTLFLHFKSKSELALSLVDTCIDSFRDKAFAASARISVFDFVRNEALNIAKDRSADSGGGSGLWYALCTDKDLAFAWSTLEKEQVSIVASYVAKEFGLNEATDVRPEIAATVLLSSAFLPYRKSREGSDPSGLAAAVEQSARIGERAARAILEAAA